MAIIFMEGMDTFNNATTAARRGILPVGSLDVKTTGGRFGGGAIQGYNGEYGNTVPFTIVSGNTVFIGFSFSQAYSTGNLGFSLARGQLSRVTGSGTNTVFYMRQLSGSTVTIYNAAGTSIGTVNMPLDGAWHWWDIKVVSLSGTSGSLEIRMDGNVVFSAVSVNMAGASALGNSWCWAFGYSYGYQGNNNGYFDDLVICDSSGTSNNDVIGDCRIITKVPTTLDAAGAWTANTGTIPTAIDDGSTPDDDTTYITSSTAADEFFVGADVLGVTPASIKGVKVTAVARKTGAEGTTMTAELKSSGVIGAGSAQSMSTSYSGISGIFPVDPNTSSPWTLSAINSLKFGGKLS